MTHRALPSSVRPSRQALRAGAVALLATSLAWPATAYGAATDPSAPTTSEATPASSSEPEVPTPAPETEAPAPETEAPAPATEAPAPATEAPAPATEAPAPTAPTPAAPASPTPSASPSGAPDVWVDPRTASMSGRVTDHTGKAPAGVEVEIVGEGRVTPAPDGTWTLGGLYAEPQIVRYRLPGDDGRTHYVYENGSRHGSLRVVVSPMLEPGEAVTGLDVVLVDNAASGTVTAGGEPVAGATVRLYRSRTDTSPVMAPTTRADGTWSVRWLTPGTYHVRVTPPATSGLAAAWFTGSFAFEGDDPRSVTRVDVDLVEEATYSGRVVDAAGKPVGGMEVALWRDDVRQVVTERTYTAADGTYRFVGLEGGSYTAQLTGGARHLQPAAVVPFFVGGGLASRDAVWSTLDVQDHATATDLVHQYGGRLAGEVVGPAGWDGVGITVELVAADGSVVTRAKATDTTSSDFRTPVVPTGSYRVRAPMPDGGWWWVGGNSFESAQVFQVTTWANRTVVLVLDAAHAQVPPAPADELTDDNRGGIAAGGPAAPGGTVRLTGVGGLSHVWLLAGDAAPRGLGWTDEGPDGTAPVVVPAGTAPGAYRLAVTTSGGYLLGWAPLTVTAVAQAPGDPVTAPVVGVTPSAATPAAATPRATAPGVRSRTGALAATGTAAGAWLAGAGIGAVLLGGGLVLLRRRRSA